MTLYVELDFCQNVVGYACRTVETKEAQFKCYKFAIIRDQPVILNVWNLSLLSLVPNHGCMGQPQTLKQEQLLTPALGLSVWFRVPV